MSLEQKLVEIIQILLADEEQGRVVFEAWQMAEGEPQQCVLDAWHQVTHYLADADIRAKDANYEAYMRRSLLECVAELEEEPQR